MKKIITFVIICFFSSFYGKSQIPPQAFNYSAVARDPSGQPLGNTTIGIQFSILKSSSTGNSQYTENHLVTTDAFGLFNLVVGGGDMQSGSMSSINWSNDNYFLEVGMDINGGTNFQLMGTTQLLSVPYAMHAKTAESISGPNTGGFTHYIGEEFGGGIIYHLWKDTSGIEHGLIVDKTDLSTSEKWSNIDQVIGPDAQSLFDGLGNSNAIVAQAGHTNSAAALCLNSTNGGFDDWYLPSISELKLLWNNYFDVGKSIVHISGATQMTFNVYHSSTEAWASSLAVSFHFGETSGEKTIPTYVRAIRSF